jgi:hypothetical protein
VASGYADKATGGGAISNVTQTGTGGVYSAYDLSVAPLTWTDGNSSDPSHSSDNNYIYDNGTLGTGWTFAVPASTTSRTLYVLAGGYATSSTITAHLSDGSASNYTATESGSALYRNLFAITYQAASASQTLTITFDLTTQTSSGGSADLAAAWLTTPAAIPAAPSGLTATAASSSQINLAWTSNSTNQTGFVIQRSPNDSTWTTLTTTAASATSYSDTTVASATTYYYRVAATNSAGNSAYTSAASATTLAAIPAAPSGLTATAASASQINLAWTSNSTNQTGFVIQRSPDGSTWTTVTATAASATSYSDTTVASGTTYYYRVCATNSAGNSAYTTAASATTPAADPAPTVTISAAGTVSADGTAIALSVLGSDLLGESSLTYTWSTTGTPPAAVSFSPNDTNAAKNATATLSKAGDYYFQVTITNAAGLSTTSDVEVPVDQIPTLTISPPSVTLAAGAQQQFAVSAIDQFGDTVDTSGVTWSVAGSDSGAITTSGLYTAPTDNAGDFAVAASLGSYSATAYALVPESNPDPTISLNSATDTTEGLQTTLSATASPGTAGDSLSYEWSISENGQPDPALTNVITSSPSYSFTPDAAGIWSYTLTVLDTTAGTSATATSNSFNVAFQQVPALTGTVSPGGSVQLQWDDVPAETGFDLQKSSDGSSWSDLSSPAQGSTSSSDTISAGGTGYYRIRALFGSTESAFSNVMKLLDVPIAPNGLSVVWNTDNSMTINWLNPSNNATSFEIDRSVDGGAFSSAGTASSGATSFTDTSVPTFNNSIAYEVKAINSAGTVTSQPGGLSIVDHITVPSSGASVSSHISLATGVTYQVRASGTIIFVGSNPGDAEYGVVNGTTYDFQISGTPVDYGIAINQPTPAALKNTRWGSYNPAHIYQTTFVGTGQPISLNYWDNYYPDNSGSLNVAIFAPLQGLTVRDDDSTNNAITTLLGGPAPKTLYVPENAQGTATIDLAPSLGVSSNQSQVTYTVTGGTASPSTGNFELGPEPVTLTPGTGSGDYVVTATIGGESVTENVDVLPYEIDAETIMDNVAGANLPLNQRGASAGAFVPVDDGDYDYDGKLDYNDNSPPAGDDRLLPIVLKGTGDSAATDFYTLSIPAGIRVWQGPAGGALTQVTPSTTLQTQNDMTLYVEGVAVGGGQVKVNWTVNGQTYQAVDSLQITSFEMSGPLDVPNYGIYEYKATGAPSGAQWLNPIGLTGMVQTGTGTSDVETQWGSGDVVGELPLQINSNYQWDVDVNVVQITVTAGTVTPTPGQATATASGNLWFLQPPGLPTSITFSNSVTVAGPDGGRGDAYMNIGYIQTATVASADGFYGTGSGQKIRDSSLDGQVFNDAESQSAWPWSSTRFTPGNGSPYTTFWQPSANGTAPFFHVDGPQKAVPLTADDTPSGTAIASEDCLLQFNRYVAAQTKCSAGATNQYYVDLASVAWQANYQGTFNGNTFTPTSPQATTAPGSFTTTTSGDAVPVFPGAPILNDALVGETWSK